MKQVKDPVCGMMIDADKAAASLTFDSTEVYFCSDQCRREFQADPDRYRLERHEPPHTVSKGGFVAPKFGSAVSGGLEYEPGPERHDE